MGGGAFGRGANDNERNICFRGANDWGANGRGANGRPATVTLWAQMAGAHMAGAQVGTRRFQSTLLSFEILLIQ